MDDKWTIIAEHFDKEKMEHFSTNWGANNKYFSKVCGISDGLTLNKESLLLVLQRVITNYNIVAILELPNHYNTDQSKINKIKKSLQFNAESRGYAEVTHCVGEPTDFMLSNDYMQVYEAFDLLQTVEMKCDMFKNACKKEEDKYNDLKDKVKKLETIRETITKDDYNKLLDDFNALKERYRNGIKECSKNDEYSRKVKDDADKYAEKTKADADDYAAKVKVEADLMKKSIERDILKSKMAKYLNEHHITLEILKEMNYERELKIAINKHE